MSAGRVSMPTRGDGGRSISSMVMASPSMIDGSRPLGAMSPAVPNILSGAVSPRSMR